MIFGRQEGFFNLATRSWGLVGAHVDKITSPVGTKPVRGQEVRFQLVFDNKCRARAHKHARAAVVRALKRIAQVGDIQVVNWLITVSITDSCFVVRDLAVEAALDLFSGPSSQLMRVWDAFPAARNREFLILQNGFLP